MRNSLSYLTVLFSVFLGTAVAAEQILMREFAVCTGRFSAEVEHSWLVETAVAERNERMYENMASLLDAVTSPTDAVRAMSIRIDAKAAHKKLLLQAVFGYDRESRQFAEERAAELRLLCSSLLLADAQTDTVKF